MSDRAVADLMVCALADCLRSEEVCTNGAASFLPVAAIGLARRTTAPGLTHLGGAVGVDSRWLRVEGSTVGPAYWEGAAALLNHPDEFWPFVGAGRITTIFHRAAQIDARGNLNNSQIRGTHPVRLPGGAAMADTAALIPRVLLWSPTHDRRTFVDRVDFRTCPGYLDRPGEREALGMPGGPDRVVTDLATMDFTADGRMRLRSLHPGVDLAMVRERTGFELVVPTGELPVTREPTAEERDLIADLDPDGYRFGEFRASRRPRRRWSVPP